MKKLLHKFGLFCCLILTLVSIVCVLFFVYVAPQYDDAYTASLLDKYSTLKSIEGPKIVLLGDSNVSFGIQSELLEDAFDMPVVNMGLQTGLGNAFLENLAKTNVTEGDIYILCHSTYSDNGKFLDPSLAWITLENHSELWKLLTPEQLFQLPAAFPYYFRNATTLWLTGKGNSTAHDVYCRAAFNPYGDISYVRDQSYFYFTEQLLPEINTTCTDHINELHAYLTDRGASLYVAAYPIGLGQYTPDASKYIAFQEQLAANLDCPVISDFTDYFFDYSYFWDSPLHLTDEGAKLRTEQLIEDLRRVQ